MSVTVKTQYGEDIRRLQLPGDEVTVEGLIKRIRALYFNGEAIPIALTYLDEDGDNINLKTTLDLENAVRGTKTALRVQVRRISDALAVQPAPAPVQQVPEPVTVPLTRLMPALEATRSPSSTVSARISVDSIPSVKDTPKDSPKSVADAPKDTPKPATAASPARAPEPAAAAPAATPDLQIWVWNPKRNQRFAVTVPAGATVADLKAKALPEGKRDRFELIFALNRLEDANVLAEYGVESGSTVHLRKARTAEKAVHASVKAVAHFLHNALQHPVVRALIGQEWVCRQILALAPALPWHRILTAPVVAVLNSGKFCKKVLPGVIDEVVPGAPLFGAVLQLLLSGERAIAQIVELAARPVSVVLSKLEEFEPLLAPARAQLLSAPAATPAAPASDMGSVLVKVLDLVLGGSLLGESDLYGSLAAAVKTAFESAAAEQKTGSEQATPAPDAPDAASSARPVHEHVTCDGCGMKPIVGARFKCTECDDFDLCEACEASGAHPQSHSMLKMYQPRQTFNFGEAGFGWLGPARPPFQRFVHALAGAPQEGRCGRGRFGGRHGPHGWCRRPEAAAALAAAADEAEAPMKDDRAGQSHGVVRFVRDASCTPGTNVAAGSYFFKEWVIRNDGTEAWPVGCKLIHVGGDLLGYEGVAETVAPSAAPGQEVSLTVPLQAPARPGRYVGYWRLVKPDGKRFGQRLCCDVLVV